MSWRLAPRSTWFGQHPGETESAALPLSDDTQSLRELCLQNHTAALEEDRSAEKMTLTLTILPILS